MANSHPKGGPASFRPSEPCTKHTGTFETMGITHSKKAQGGSHDDKIRKRRMPTGPLSLQRPVTLFLLTSVFSHQITSPFLSQPAHGERRAFFAVTKGLLAATAQAPSLTPFLAQHFQGDAAAQGHPRKFPIFRNREIVSPDWSCSIALRTKLSTLSSHCSQEEVPSLSVHDSTLPSQSGLFGKPHVS